MRGKIAHLTTVHHPFDPRIFHKQLKSLRDAGYEAHLVAPHERSQTVDGVSVVALPEVNGRYRRILLQGSVYRAARALDADCYHFHDPELIPVGYLLKKSTGARVIYDMHENYWWHGPLEGRFIRAFERWCFRWVDHVVVANSSQVGIPQASNCPNTVIKNYSKCSEPERASEKGRAKALSFPVRLIYAGVNSEDRGLFNLIDLAFRVQKGRMESQVEIVGICNREVQRKRAKRQIQQLNIDNHVLSLVGWDQFVPWRELMSRCQRAHVGLILWNSTPHHLETIPTKFFQYMNCGLPILCSDFPRWRRFVETHSCGAVVPPGDVDAAVRVLKRWQSNPDEYRALSAAAREASEQYRWKEMGDRLVRLYDELLV